MYKTPQGLNFDQTQFAGLEFDDKTMERISPKHPQTFEIFLCGQFVITLPLRPHVFRNIVGQDISKHIGAERDAFADMSEDEQRRPSDGITYVSSSSSLVNDFPKSAEPWITGRRMSKTLSKLSSSTSERIAASRLWICLYAAITTIWNLGARQGRFALDGQMHSP